METSEMKRCPHCKKEIPAEMHYCMHCMTRLDEASPQVPYRIQRRWLLPLCCVVAIVLVGVGVWFLFLRDGSRGGAPTSGDSPSAATTTAPSSSESTSSAATTAPSHESRMYLADLVGMNYRYVTSLLGEDFTPYNGEGYGCVYQEEGLILYYVYPENEQLSTEDICIAAEIYGDHYLAGDIHTAVSKTELQTTALSYGAYDVGAYDDVQNPDKEVAYFTFQRDNKTYEVYATYDYGAQTPEKVRLKLVEQE